MDIELKKDNWNFKFRVCGIIEQEGKYLIMKIDDASYFHIPGGHVELGEDTNIAVCCEVKEEVGCEVKINKLFCINENFYKKNDEKYHEIAFYYSLTLLEKLEIKDYEIMENDKGEIKKLSFIWVDQNQLESIDLRPNLIKNLIIENKIDAFTHSINKEK